MAEKALSGGDKLTAKLAELSKKLEKAAQVRIGMLEGSTEALSDIPTATVATWMEWGTQSDKGELIPPRPFFRTMIAEHSGEWGDQLAKVLVHNNYDAENALGQMGMLIGGELQESIIAVTEPPLKQSTIDRKGFSKPLVDSGNMLNSVAYQVDSEEKVFVDPSRART